MEWEYIIREWSFIDPAEDDWPKRQEYLRLLLAQLERRKAEREANRRRGYFEPGQLDVTIETLLEGPEGERLNAEYMRWRLAEESAYLNEFGAAGFELVSINRHRSPLGYTVPPVDVFAYFKRPKMPDAPPAPSRPIGFDPNRARTDPEPSPQ